MCKLVACDGQSCWSGLTSSLFKGITLDAVQGPNSGLDILLISICRSLAVE